MRHTTAPGWHVDPSSQHQLRYWDGGQWTDAVVDDGTTSHDDGIAGATEPPSAGDRLAGAAIALLLVGGAAALAASVVWSGWMRTSATLDADERVRGWTALLRDLPTVVLAWAVPIGALALAVRACRKGAGAAGRVASWLSVAVLFVVSVSTIGGTVVDSALDADPSVKWMLLPVSIAVAAAAAVAARRATRASRRVH